jgi:hypothetical protein
MACALSVRDESFPAWVTRVQRLCQQRLGLSLDEIPELALHTGFEAGDTPAEFFAGCIAPWAVEADTEVQVDPTWRTALDPPG